MHSPHTSPNRIFVGLVPSPIGPLAFLTDDAALRGLDLRGNLDELIADFSRRHGDIAVDESADPLSIQKQLDAYFGGDVRALDATAAIPDGTPFQLQVWTHLRSIRAGTTTTYGAIAHELGKPSSTRAVGAANGANPIPLVIPCHRVIGANGTLTGYGGGLHRKEWLLRHEGAEIPLFATADAV
jgi:methylated-DNA-[protein]-cysteine S-methyltransferase